MSIFHRRRPPFCPNPLCHFHENPGGWPYKRAGFFFRARPPFRVQRYQCSHCGRSFSSQTFSVSYWLKRPDLLEPVYSGLVSCAGLRQLARIHGVSPSTIMGHTTRLGLHCLLYQQQHRPQAAPREPVVVDGFESFEFSQFHPMHVNLAVGAESHFIYAFTDAELRRKGRMTARQAKQRSLDEARWGRPDPQALEFEMAELIRLFAPRGSTLWLRSDEHRAYPRAFRSVEGVRIVHEMTSSKQARTTGNPLFAVNRIDLLTRHCSANHKRETIAYSKRRQSLMERYAVFVVWQNFQKSRSEKLQDAPPAQRLGRVNHKLSTSEILSRRLFPSQIRLPARWRIYYERRTRTRRIPNGAERHLRYAN